MQNSFYVPKDGINLGDMHGVENMRVTFYEDAVVKTNALEVLKQFGIDEVVSV